MPTKKAKSPKTLAEKLNPKNIIYPVLIGFGFVAFMIYRNFDVKAFDVVVFSWHSILWLMVAFLFMAFRDLGYILRIRILSDNQLSWIKAIRIIMLWEFTSAITPAAVGGTSFAVIFVNKEGISIGKSSAIVLATSFLDEMYFAIVFPLLLIFIDFRKLFLLEGSLSFANELFYFAIIGYSIKLIFVLFLMYGMFKNPRGLKKLLVNIFNIKYLRKWRYKAAKAGTEIVESSNEFKRKPFGFWLKAIGATAFSWTSRYCVINAMFLAFVSVKDHSLLFARQVIMWIIMLVSPTPGGSGFSEFVFDKYLRDFLPNIAGISILLATLWRLITYYPYLIIGASIVPGWIRKKFIVKDKNI
jgi:glycosyltransferase 2 family protein